MRTGPEQYVIKGFSFYDSMIIPVLGVNLILIYEVMRRFVWRDPEYGTQPMRDLSSSGLLVVKVTRHKLSQYTGLSVRKITDIFRELKRLGWIVACEGVSEGRALIFELGYRTEEGAEVFYADGYLRRLWTHLEFVAASVYQYEKVTSIPVEDRIETTRQWCRDSANDGNDCGFTGGGKSCNSRVNSDPPLTDLGATPEGTPCGSRQHPDPPEYEKLIVNNKILKNKIKGGDDERPRTPDELCSSSVQSPPQPSGTEGLRPTGSQHCDREGPARRTFSNAKETRRPNMVVNAPRSGSATAEERQAAAVAAGDRGSAKAEKQKVDNLRRQEEKRRRQAQRQALDNESRSENLSGGMEKREVVDAVKRLEKRWRELIAEDYPEVSVPPWYCEDKSLTYQERKKLGEGKTRGQVSTLVRSYGEDLVAVAFRYVVSNWDALSQRIFGAKASVVPIIGLLFKYREMVFSEAQLWVEYEKVIEEMREWERENGWASAPKDLQRRFDKADEALERMTAVKEDRSDWDLEF